jgi:GWxTD domain-containing protein
METDHLSYIRVCILFVFLLTINGCGTSSPYDSEETFTGYTMGELKFDLLALPSWSNQQLGVVLYLSVPAEYLTFVRSRDGFSAVVSMYARFRASDKERKTLEVDWMDTVTVSQYGASRGYQPVVFRRQCELGKGSYRVDVRLEDHQTGRWASKRQTVNVPNLSMDVPVLGSVVLLSKSLDGKTIPRINPHVPLGLRELRATVTAFNVRSGARIHATMTVSRLRTDSLAAVLPYGIMPSFGSLQYLGVDADVSTRVLTISRDTLAGDTVTELEFPLDSLGQQGVHRLVIEIRCGDASSSDTLLSTGAYDFSLMPENYPRPATYQQLVGSMVYLMTEDEKKELLLASTAEEMRKQFELFWLKLGKNQQGASNLIKQYFGRVEEANILFASHKEGWKTDRGMLYIVLGPPTGIARRVDAEVWSYTYNDADVRNMYTFKRNRSETGTAGFENYVLIRQDYYDQSWFRALDRWKRGTPP